MRGEIFEKSAGHLTTRSCAQHTQRAGSLSTGEYPATLAKVRMALPIEQSSACEDTTGPDSTHEPSQGFAYLSSNLHCLKNAGTGV